MKSEQATVSVSFDLKVTLIQDSTGWWTAHSRVGSVTHSTRELCLQALRDIAAKG